MRWLVCACSGLGDTILKIPMLRELHRLDPSAVVDVIAYRDREVDKLFERSPWVNQVLPLSWNDSWFERVKFFRGLRKHRYQAVFISYETAHPALIFGSYLAGIERRVMHDGRTHGSLRNRLRERMSPWLPGTLLSPLQANRHKIDLNLDLLELYFKSLAERDYSTPIHKEETAGAILERFGLVKGSYLVFQPGAAKGITTPKTWAPDHFIELIKALKRRWPELAMVTVGDWGDAEASGSLQRELPYVINTAGLTTVMELAELLQHARLTICHDSGVMHLANALETDLIALYGPTDDACTRPLGKRSSLLFSNNECRRLMHNWGMAEFEIAKRYPPYYCLSGISVDEVYEACSSKLILN